jgi:Zn-finger nucleic acid-binding protein
MKCPNCDETLVMTERQGVEIDYCPKCRGVWLDKGELDKIIERTAGYDGPQGNQTPSQQGYSNEGYGGGGHHGHHGGYNKHRKGFFGNLFDF